MGRIEETTTRRRTTKKGKSLDGLFRVLCRERRFGETELVLRPRTARFLPTHLPPTYLSASYSMETSLRSSLMAAMERREFSLTLVISSFIKAKAECETERRHDICIHTYKLLGHVHESEYS